LKPSVVGQVFFKPVVFFSSGILNPPSENTPDWRPSARLFFLFLQQLQSDFLIERTGLLFAFFVEKSDYVWFSELIISACSAQINIYRQKTENGFSMQAGRGRAGARTVNAPLPGAFARDAGVYA